MQRMVGQDRRCDGDRGGMLTVDKVQHEEIQNKASGHPPNFVTFKKILKIHLFGMVFFLIFQF